MDELQFYFEPLNSNLLPENFSQGQIGATISAFSGKQFVNLENINVAIIGVSENRNSALNVDTSFAADAIRPFLYKLQNHFSKIKIADLGNLKIGKKIEDTYEAVAEIIKILIQKNILPIVIGGSQDLTYSNYLAYEKSNRIINILSIDSIFDIEKPDNPFSNNSWLNRIIFRDPNFLFNYSNIGYQTYLVEEETIALMKKLFFDTIRLGVANANIAEIEPIIRNADLLSFDMSAIRMSDCPASSYPSPNGFFGQEACQIMRYAGMSEKLSSVGLYELCPSADVGGISVSLAAQMIWYFIEGFSTRNGENPHLNKDAMIKYIVSLQEINTEISFYRNPITERWWMEVPCTNNLAQKFERHYMVPCSYNDYAEAMKNQLPDRWWQTYQKFM